MITMWLVVGAILFNLYKQDSDNKTWISDWINAAVAIGTIGAVLTSLYLSAGKAIPNRKKALKFSFPNPIEIVDKNCAFTIKIVNRSSIDILIFEIILCHTDGERSLVNFSPFANTVLRKNFRTIVTRHECGGSRTVNSNSKPQFFIINTSIGGYKVFPDGKPDL